MARLLLYLELQRLLAQVDAFVERVRMTICIGREQSMPSKSCTVRPTDNHTYVLNKRPKPKPELLLIPSLVHQHLCLIRPPIHHGPDGSWPKHHHGGDRHEHHQSPSNTLSRRIPGGRRSPRTNFRIVGSSLLNTSILEPCSCQSSEDS